MSDNNKKQNEYNRRDFLKQAGSLGTIVAGTSLSNSVLAANYPQGKTKNVDCAFSKLGTDFTYLNSGTEGSMPECVINELSNRIISGRVILRHLMKPMKFWVSINIKIVKLLQIF